MPTLSIIIGIPIGILGFLFLIWRRLREDYTTDRIFSFSFTVGGFLILGFVVGIFLQSKIVPSHIFNPAGMWFWFSFLFSLIGFGIGFYKFKLRFFETLESVGIAFLFWLFPLFLISSIKLVDIRLLLFCVFEIVLIILFYFLDSRYKSFSWYKSGRVGFAGLCVLVIFFLIRLVVALILPNMLSFIGKFDAICDVVVAFAFLITLLNLSGL